MENIRVVYLDVLLLCNFFADYILILITEKISKNKTAVHRKILSAIFGAVFAAFMFFYRGGSFAVFALNIAALLILTALAFPPRNFLQFIKQSGMLLAVAFIMGGGMTALDSFFGNNTSFRVKNGSFYLNFSFAKIIFFAGIVFLIANFAVSRKNKADRFKASLTVDFFGEKVSGPALIDSGNGLRDMISGEKVILCDKKALEKFAKPLENHEERKIFLPVCTVTGETILEGFRSDFAEIEFKNEKKRFEKSLFAFSKTALKDDFIFIISPDYIEGHKERKNEKQPTVI